MSARSYLSIGDVLTLLRQEFPDVTISKIRFLESQGLVNPERTPSGYRKFYEHDVERLRWVLRQQRENFLPLKVIKDRLDDEQTDVGDLTPVPSEAGEQPAEEPVLVGHRASTGPHEASGHQEASGQREPAARGRAPGGGRAVGATSPVHAEGPSVDGTTLPGIETETNGTNGSSARALPGRTEPSATPLMGEAEPQPSPTAVDAPVPTTRSRAAKGGGGGRSGPRGKPAVPASGPVEPDRATEAVGASEAPGAVETARGGRGQPLVAPVEAEPDLNAAEEPGLSAASPGSRAGATLSIEEVASASGLEPSVVEELVAYGLLVSTRVAGLPCFDQEAVALATLAAGFARFGVEPRHLRLYKNTADREVGFIEQIVLPLVRQRNPEARLRATETADELLRLGQLLRSSLVRSSLGTLLDS